MAMEEFFVDPLEEFEAASEVDLSDLVDKDEIHNEIREFEMKTGMTLEQYKEFRRNGGKRLLGSGQLSHWERCVEILPRLELGEVIDWTAFGCRENPDSIDVLRESVEEWEESAGMTVEEYRAAVEAGEIRNYSTVLLSMIEEEKKWLKELEQRGE